VTADDRAWDVLAEALDPDTAVAARVPTGAAILAADAQDRDVLIQRCHDEGRVVVLVDQDGRERHLLPPKR
jgi:hypothetical protein